MKRFWTVWKKSEVSQKDEAERILGFQLRPAKVRTFAFQQAGLSTGKEPWNRMNFDLPSVVLSRLWRIPIQNVHNQRIRNKRGAPKWKASWNRDWMQDESFRAAQAAEEIAAHSYFHRTQVPRMFPRPRVLHGQGSFYGDVTGTSSTCSTLTAVSHRPFHSRRTVT